MITLEASYAECKRLNKRYGTTYYWSTMLLPSVKRPHVHALYGFCRHADDIVDNIVDEVGDVSVERRSAALAELRARFFSDLDRGHSADLVLKAVVHTVRAFDIDPDGFARFLRSMEMDLTVERYETWEDLRRVHGWLCRRDRRDDAPDPRADRSLDCDRPSPGARRGVPADQLPPRRRRGPRPWPSVPAAGGSTPLWRRPRRPPLHAVVRRPDALRDRPLSASSTDVPRAASPCCRTRSARCIRAAHDLYGRILDCIEAQGYDVFAGRARVSTPRKLAVAARHLTATGAGLSGSTRWSAVATVAAGVAATGMIATPLARRGGTWRQRWANLVVGGLAVTTKAFGGAPMGHVAGGGRSGVIVGCALAVERAGTATGVPFGRYRYTGLLRPTVVGVPVVVPLAWWAMGLPAREVAHAALGRRTSPALRTAVGRRRPDGVGPVPRSTDDGRALLALGAAGQLSRRSRSRTTSGWLLTSAGMMVVLERLLPPSRPDRFLVGEYAAMGVDGDGRVRAVLPRPNRRVGRRRGHAAAGPHRLARRG